MLCRTSLSWFNWALLVINGLFHVLHLVQSHWTYDGTAQDTIISSSQVKSYNIFACELLHPTLASKISVFFYIKLFLLYGAQVIKSNLRSVSLSAMSLWQKSKFRFWSSVIWYATALFYAIK